MSPEERQLLTALFDRVNSAASTAPRDPDAETLINQATRQQPATAYYLAQAVIVQEKGLEAADAHIRELESRIRQLEAGNSPQSQTQGGGFLNSIFGTSQPQQQPRPQPVEAAPGPWGRNPVQQMPQSAPQPSQGPWSSPQPSSVPSVGGGFLRGALGTAAGVAGGMLLANSLGGIFSNHMASSGLGSMFGGTAGTTAPVEETVINNYYGNDNPQIADNSASDNNDGFEQADYDDSGSDFSEDTSDV